MRLLPLLCLFIFAVACETTEADRVILQKNARTQRITAALAAMDDLVFVKHEKSGMCFAYGWAGYVHGGPMLAAVPCADVENLLVGK